MTTIHGFLERNARKFPNKEAFITSTNRLSYLEMNEKANQMARYLQGQGIGSGDRVAIMSRNNEHFLYSYFALLKLGATVMPLNARLTAGEVSTILKNVDANGLLFESVFINVIKEMVKEWSPAYLHTIESASEESMQLEKSDLNLSMKTTDICEILFTSGTTGVPKGVLFSHERMAAVAAAIAIEQNFSRDDKVLTMMPLSHSAPLNAYFIAPLYCGAAFVIGDFAPKAFLEWIDKEKTTFTFAAPVAYLLAAKEPNIKDYVFSSMRGFAYGGSAMPLASYEYVANAFGNTNFYQVYGLTEAGPNGCMLRPKEHLIKSGSIGKQATVNMEMKVIREDGSQTAPGEYGEILLKGDSLMLGYYNNEQATAETVKDGWLYTGDIAYTDDDGYVYIIDRKKDIIIPGGVNVYPREVEEVLTKHPAVYQACVVGIPDEEWGETVKAVIVLKENENCSEADLKGYVKNHLADYKHPRIYSFVKELPFNASGKLLKQKVKEM
ncbi:class I adenylate-forming enzyme family protein [Alkalihalobacterium elongatum]|uniref:class I adenylate-forming enzyme family protein n=1 Tax=Alkalihalobacterium elongatum TaxID=2675466 RepID=UPI001C1FD92E|nr:AMP-binding protein [Alkalihalobacterium elongatum]